MVVRRVEEGQLGAPLRFNRMPSASLKETGNL
jgi:hypothetical protein